MSAPAKPATRPTPGKRRSRKGILLLVTVLLAGSGAIRIGVGVAEAVGREETTPIVVAQTTPDPTPLLAALQEREARVAAMEAALSDRMQALALAERHLTDQMAALVAAEQELAATLIRADQAAEGDLARLTSVYESMKPKEAAVLFEEMAPEFAAGFLARMRPEAAAGVMAGLEPRSAYAISVLLAGRNALVPKE